MKSKIQSVLIPKKNKSKLHAVNFPKICFTLKQSHKWLLDHNYKIPNKVDETTNFYRYRQKLPNKNYNYTTEILPNGVELVLMWKKDQIKGSGINKNRFNELAEKILERLTDKDIDEFQTAQLEQNTGGGIAVDSKFKAFQMKQIIEDVLKEKPEMRIKYKSATKSKLINILDQLEKDGLLSGYNFSQLPSRNPKTASVGDILKKFGTKTLSKEEQEEFLKEFESSPKYQNVYEGAEQDIRTGQKVKPLDHQKKFIQQFALSNLRGVVAFHGVGSGKTLTAVISSYYFLKLFPNRNVVVISPSALLFNFLQGMIQYGLNIRDNRYKFFTYDKYLRRPFDTTGALVIVDEAHNFRTEIEKSEKTDDKGDTVVEVVKNKRGFKLMNTATKNCYKLILLTGTAFVNKIYDVENLLAMIDNREPISESSFTDAITNPLNLSSYFNYKISYYERGADENFPKKNEELIPIIMTEKEENEYDKIKREGPPDRQISPLELNKRIQNFIEEEGRNPNEEELKELKLKESDSKNQNSFYSAEQFASNAIKGEDGINPKVKYIINLIKERPKEKFIIYSTFIHTGIDNLVKELNKLDLPNTKPVFITGRESSSKKEESKILFNNYKMQNSTVEYTNPNNDCRILFITKAGAEGVDTKNCQNIVLFDELWNDATAEQVIARAVRYKSHQELPVNQRYVNVIRTIFIKKDDEELFELLLEENPQWSKIDEKIKNYKLINKDVDTGLSNNKIKALPNFNLNEFYKIAESVTKAPVGNKEAQKIRRDKIRQLEQKYLDKVEKDFKNGVKGYKVKYEYIITTNINKYIKDYETIKTAYGKRNLKKNLPQYHELNDKPFFDKNEYEKAKKDNQEMVYFIQVQNAIDNQNKKAVLSPDLLNAIERDEKKPIPAVDLFKFILTKSKEQRIRYFIENFDVNNNNSGDITLYEYYESKYRKMIEKELKRTGEELTPELEIKLIKSIVDTEKEDVADILFTDIQKNKIEEFNKRTKQEKLQQFYTPPDIAYELADKIFENMNNISDLRILEPTAGEGGLLIPFIKPKNKKLIDYNDLEKFKIDLVELDPKNREYLQKLTNRGKTFLTLEEEPNFLRFSTSNRYNIIITNPPFHLRKGENIGLKRDVWDVDFIFKAIPFLRIGGVLGAIVGNTDTSDKYFKLTTDQKKNEIAIDDYGKYRFKLLSDKLQQVGDLEIIKLGKRQFGSINTIVSFVIFKKKSTELDGYFLIESNKLYNEYLLKNKIPNFIPQETSLIIEPKKGKGIKKKGGNIDNEELKKFVDAGYKTKSEAENIDGYVLDKELSTKRDKVYYDPKSNKAVHTIAGTDKALDWTNNLLIPLGLHQYSNRYKNAERIQKEANKKYGKENLSLVSHSQSGNIAQNLAKKKLVGDENITLNPAIIGSHKKNVKVVRSSGDVVSALTLKNKKDKTINTGSWNPLYNHSTEILTKKKKKK